MMRSNDVRDDDVTSDDVADAGDDDDVIVVRNVTSVDPVFLVRNLEPGSRYEAVVYASNVKGRSRDAFVLKASTLKAAPGAGDVVNSLASGKQGRRRENVRKVIITLCEFTRQEFKWETIDRDECQ